jgi:hypothetical protein
MITGFDVHLAHDNTFFGDIQFKEESVLPGTTFDSLELEGLAPRAGEATSPIALRLLDGKWLSFKNGWAKFEAKDAIVLGS